MTETLNDARADYVAQGHAPAGVLALLQRLDDVTEQQRAAVLRLEDEPGVDAGSDTALLLGCRYAQTLPTEARAAIRLAAALGSKVRLLSGCCGAWQRAAGAPAAAEQARAGLQRQLARARRLLVLDPRCALELKGLEPVTLVELAARHADRFAPGSLSLGPLRYHDTCALGRGLGLYTEPRALLQRAAGAPPLELEQSRELARCSGAGGLLPVSMPEVAQGAANRLLGEHAALGGGTLVTSCASSLGHLRAQGGDVVDLISVLEACLRRDG